MRDPAPWQKKYDRMLMLALLFGIISQYLIVGRALGISVILFVLGFYGLFFYAAKGRTGGFEKWQGQLSSGWLLMIPIGLLTLTYGLFANTFFHGLNILALLALIIAQTMLLTRGGSQPWHRTRFYKDMLIQSIASPLLHIAVPFSLIGSKFKASDQTNPTRSNLRKISFGLLLAAPILIVVVTLLASADRIFLSWLNRIPDLFHVSNAGDGIVRMTFAAIIALYSFCYLWGLLFRKANEGVNAVSLQKPIEGSEQKQKEPSGFDPVTAGTLLISINAVYLLFVAIQFSYLFGAANGLLPEGAAYAEYARKGFGELVMVALINICLLLCGLHLIRRTSKAAEMVRKISLSLLVGCTVIMLISAYSRLSLYEEAYGFTQTRLLVHGFMLFLGILLIIAMVRIWKERFSLGKAYICTAIIAYMIMNYANLDARIATNNIERFERTGVIDMYYLGLLSTDAAPALLKLQEKHPKLEGLNEVITDLRLKARSNDGWQSWSLSKQRAK